MPLIRYYIWITTIFVMSLVGCAGHNIYFELSKELQSGDCQAASTLMAKSQKAYGDNSQLLYLLDSAVVNLQCQNFNEAQQQLHAAEQLADKLWTESLSRNVVAMVTNDYTLPYAGEDYERVMIHLISAIGYLHTEQLDEALVEIRRLDSLLQMYADKYREDEVYKKDAFGRYLSGMLHEADGAHDDAFIDYYKAAEAYQNEWRRYGIALPEILAEDLMRMAVLVNRMDDAARVLPQNLLDQWDGMIEDADTGKVVAIVFNGEGPQKTQEIAVVPTRKGPVSVAFPKIVTGLAPCRAGDMHVERDHDSYNEVLTLVSDINQIALKTLQDRKGRIVAKAVARAIAKQVVITSIANTQKEKEKQDAVAALLNVANLLALERADTRCWQTLPGNILLARAYMAPGEYTVRIRLCQNQVRDLGSVKVDAGQTRFLFLDTHFKGPTTQK